MSPTAGRVGNEFVNKDLAMQAFFLQDPDSERLVRIERHTRLLLERQRIGRIDTLILLLNPLLIAGLGFVLTTVYEGGVALAVWFLNVPAFVLFIMFVIGFVGVLVSFLWYVAAYLKDTLASRVNALSALTTCILFIVVADASMALIWEFAWVLGAIGGGIRIMYLLAIGALLLLATRTGLRVAVWLGHRYMEIAPLAAGDEQPCLDELVDSDVSHSGTLGFFGQFFWWGSCVLYGVGIVSYVFELAFYGFPLPFAIEMRLSKEVLYNIVGLLLMVCASLVVRWKMKHWRVEGKWWAVDYASIRYEA